MELSQFVRESRSQVLADVTPIRDDKGNSPVMIIRNGSYAAVLRLMPFGDHLCIDVHGFKDDEQVTSAAFGMTTGKSWELPATGTTSHGWNSANLISVLIGEQA